jgi:hypothetical protein
MGTSQAAIDRHESGGVGATLTTLQRVATALDLEVIVELRPSARPAGVPGWIFADESRPWRSEAGP